MQIDGESREDSYNAENVYALSWSLDYDKANWFAHRFDEDGTVYRARIDKKNILAFFGAFRCGNKPPVLPGEEKRAKLQ